METIFLQNNFLLSALLGVFTLFTVLLLLVQDYVWGIAGLAAIVVLCIIYVNKNKPKLEVEASKEEKQLQ